MKKYVKIFRNVRIPWLLLLVVAALYIAEAQVSVKTVRLSADIIDSSQKTIDLQPLLRYLAYTAALVGCISVSAWVAELTYGRIRLGVRNKLFNHILHLPAGYFDRESGNEMVSRITSDTDMCSYYFEVILTSFSALYQAYVVFKSLIGYNKQLGVYSMLIIPVTCIIAGVYGLMTYSISRMSVNSQAETTGYLFERTAAFRVIKAYNTAAREKRDSGLMFKKMFRAEMLNEMTIAFIQLGMQLISCISTVIAFVFGSRLVKNGTLTIGELIAFYSLSGMVGVQLINLFLNFGTFTAVNGSLKNVAMILETPEEKADGRELDSGARDLRLEHVTFSYDGQPVLTDVSFTVPKNRVTAIIGPNGSGKSTALKLLQRMYEPDAGRLLIGEEEASAYSLSSWRRQFSVVSQRAPLISGTIRDNMCYGCTETVSDERLLKVAGDCGILEYIQAQKDGADSMIAVGSTNLSGGQRQSLAVARAVLKDSSYLLLDEATGSLDAKSERTVKDSLTALMEERTTVMIAHHPSVIERAEHIIVMEDGRVTAEGSRDELLETSAYYRNFIGEE